jgi:hypothetical protein
MMHTRAFKDLFSGRPGRRRGRKPATRFSLVSDGLKM